MVGLYVFGSAAAGDFEPASSDIDFLAVTEQAISRDEADRLAEMHRRLASSSPWSRRLEGEYSARGQLRAWGIVGSVATMDPGQGFRYDSVSEFTAENMLAVREQGIALFGPPSESVVPPVDRKTFETALRTYLGELAEPASGAESTPKQLSDWTLNIARCLFGLHTGRLSTKRQAADWLARARTELEPALLAAVRTRQGQVGVEEARLLQEGFRLLAGEIRALPTQNE